MTKKAKPNKLPDDIIAALNLDDVIRISNWITPENIDYIDEYGRSLIFHSILSGFKNIFIELLKSKPNLNLQDSKGWTALHFTAQLYLADIANLLFENGADIEIKDAYGNTPLWRAVYDSKGKGEMIRFLLSKGADRYSENNYGVSPLKLANTIANYDVKQFFSSSVD